MNEIPYGYCQCGCGQKTNIAPQSDKRSGLVKGEPMRFVYTHQTKGKPAAIRFWEKVDKSAGDDVCWNWCAYRNENGYGEFGVGKRSVKAHRYSWILSNGDIPNGMGVLHKCDNPACVNPSHLFLGTQLDNVKDMINKGRMAKPELGSRRGEKNSQHKLTAKEVVEIRELYSRGGVTQAEIGMQFGVSESMIWRIVTGKNWKHICPRCQGHRIIGIRNGDDSIDCPECADVGEVVY